MKLIIETDNHISGTQDLRDELSKDINKHLGKFESHITTVQVNLSDQNAKKSGPDDKKCSFEVRLKGENPLQVVEYGETIRSAFSGALDKALRITRDTVEKKKQHRG